MTHPVSHSNFSSRMNPQDQMDSGVLANKLIRERVRRSKYFPPEMFADPAWDILLELYALQMREQRVTAGQLSNNSVVPATTALRWIKVLDAAGYVLRKADPLDARRVFILLTGKGLDAMYLFLSGVSDDSRGAPPSRTPAQHSVHGDPFGSLHAQSDSTGRIR